jgi:xylulokinase
MHPEADGTYVLAVDHGTSGIKASLVSMSGRVVDSAYHKTPVFFSHGGGAEQDPEDWWQGFIKTSRELIGRGSVPTVKVAAVCVSSTFSSTVAVGADGMHLMNALTWMDSRGAKYIKEIMSGFPSVEGYNIFKLLRWIPKTGGGPTLSGKDDIAHVLLLKHEYPEVYAKARAFIPSKDYFNLRLTGRIASSHDAIQLFWLTDTRDANNIKYDEGLAKTVGIDISKLPPLMKSIDTVGELLPAVAREIGLPSGVKVVSGAADHQAALVGSGAVRDFEAHLYIGTSSWVQCVVPFKKIDAFHYIASLPAAIPGRYQSVNEQDIAGGSLAFLVEFLFPREVRNAMENPYRLLDEMAVLSPPGSNSLIFTPWLNGERTPVDDTTLRGGIHNISITTTRNDIVRALLEGVAYNTKWSLGYVEKFCGRRLDPINMVGGGAKSPLWCQIFADVFGRTIRQVKNPIHANARGAAYLAAVGLGYITFDDIPGLVEIENTYSPNAANSAVYARLYGEFLNIYKSGKPIYRRLNVR